MVEVSKEVLDATKLKADTAIDRICFGPDTHYWGVPAVKYPIKPFWSTGVELLPGLRKASARDTIQFVAFGADGQCAYQAHGITHMRIRNARLQSSLQKAKNKGKELLVSNKSKTVIIGVELIDAS